MFISVVDQLNRAKQPGSGSSAEKPQRKSGFRPVMI